MRLIKPVDVTPTQLISSNVPENDHPIWSATATYALGTRVQLVHNVYEALAAVPAGIKPGEEVLKKTRSPNGRTWAKPTAGECSTAWSKP